MVFTWKIKSAENLQKASRKIGGRIMLKEYRKTATIKAEQFDGSEEMIKKYGIGTIIDNYQHYIETLEGDFVIHIDDWIATGVEGEYWAIADEIFKKTYEEVDQTLFQKLRRELDQQKNSGTNLIGY